MLLISNSKHMQTPYNGIFLKSETAALLCNNVLKLVIDVYKPVYLRCGKDAEIMTACMEAVPAQFTEEMYEKYTRQICNRNRDFKALLCTVIKQMASERHEKDGYRVVLEGTEDVVGKVFVKRFLIAMAASDSVRSGRFFDPNQTVECALVTQTNARDCLWGIADEFIRVENPDDATSDVESEASTAVSKRKRNKKSRRARSEVSVVSSVSHAAPSINDHDIQEDEVDEDDWGDVDDTIKPMDSVSQVFASTDNRSHTSEPTQIKMSPPLQFPPKSAVYTPPSHHPPQPPPPAQYPPPPPPPPPPPIRSTGYYS